ncbi:MAG: hypothetical protein Q8L26_09375 [Candidatus Omnitrophota bacterium]|nr:hypothetical protein [Candidatus Omnitrophota bacterium]
MKYVKIKPIFILFIAIIVVIIVGVFIKIKSIYEIKDCIMLEKPPLIQPDYSNTVIPFNIAPLNFYIKEKGENYYVRIFSQTKDEIRLHSRSSGIMIPINQWRKLLYKNKGNDLYFEIFTRKEGIWYKHKSIVNKIAKEKIDSFLVYRDIAPQFYQKTRMMIYQRDLENYNKQLILDSRAIKDACFNCHTFYKNNTEKFIIQTRYGGRNYMALNDNGKVSLIAPVLRKPGSAYLSWHPSGKIIALTVNMSYRIFNRFLGSIPEEMLEYGDIDGDIALYNIQTHALTTDAGVSRVDMVETQPNWSSDGKYLYFLSAPKLSIKEYEKIKYDLMRISYDTNKNVFGEPEVLISALDTGLGVTFPKVSPEGKFLLFCMTDRSSFSILRSKTDLYLMDLRNAKYRRLEINSDRTDSYHSWGSNSRWFVFTSKRDDGVFGKAYFSYVDENGKVYKPFVLPQKDPYFYDSFIRTYNVPELIQSPIKINRFYFGRQVSSLDNIIEVTPDQPTLSEHKNNALESGSEEYEPYRN